jgi:hypothetical protein
MHILQQRSTRAHESEETTLHQAPVSRWTCIGQRMSASHYSKFLIGLRCPIRRLLDALGCAKKSSFECETRVDTVATSPSGIPAIQFAPGNLSQRHSLLTVPSSSTQHMS